MRVSHETIYRSLFIQARGVLKKQLMEHLRTKRSMRRSRLDANQVQELLEQRWTPAGVTLPDETLIPEVLASVIRMTGGNFRLLTRLLTQIERVLQVNDLHLISNEVVEAARDSLVIGTS
jgi:DNA transposition AAA+ family ATPase